MPSDRRPTVKKTDTRVKRTKPIFDTLPKMDWSDTILIRRTHLADLEARLKAAEAECKRLRKHSEQVRGQLDRLYRDEACDNDGRGCPAIGHIGILLSTFNDKSPRKAKR